jgi:Flp pilus assembly pilin Flp
MFIQFAALIRVLRADRRAVTSLEYGLIASLVAVGIISEVTTAGLRLATVFTVVASHM